jgi:hypothetical protein
MQFVFRFRQTLSQSCSIARYQQFTEAALTNMISRHCRRLRPHPSLREHGSLFPARRSTLGADTDDLYRCLENIAEPNLDYAQQNRRSPMPTKGTILAIFKESSEDDSTNKRFNLLSFLSLLL